MISNRLTSLHAKNTIAALLLLMAVTVRFINVSYQSMIGKNKMLQLTAAENILSGKGYGIEKYYTHNISDPELDTSVQFPPGYSVSIIPFILSFHHHLEKASLAFELLTALLFLLTIRKMLRVTGFPPLQASLFTLVAGCFPYPFFTGSPPTDAVALLFTLVSLLLIIRLYKEDNAARPLVLIIYSLVFFLPSFYRFSYLPVSAVLPVLVFLAGVLKNKPRLRKHGGWSVIITYLFLAALLVYQKKLTGHFLPQYPGAEPGFFPENLYHIYPFLPASVSDIDFLAQLMNKITDVSYTSSLHFFEILTFACLPVLIYGVFILLKRFLADKSNSSLLLLVATGTVLCIIFFFTLIYSSFTISYAKYNQAALIQEPRLWSFPLLFIQLSLFVLLFKKEGVKKKLAGHIILVTLGVLLFAETAHRIYFNTKVLFNYRAMKETFVPDADYRYFESLCTRLKKQNENKELLITSTDRYYCNKAMLNGDKAVFDIESLNTDTLQVKKASVLVMVVPETDQWIMKNFVTRLSLVPDTVVSGTGFYTINLNP